MKYRNLEFAVISIDPAGNLAGIRARTGGRVLNVTASAAEYLPREGDGDALTRRLERLGGELRLNRGEMLFLTGHVDGGMFFEVKMPRLPAREIRDSLLLELGNHMPAVPVAPEVVWQARPGRNEEELLIRAYAFDSAVIAPLGRALLRLNWRIDAFVPLLLALPDDAAGFFQEFGGGFARVGKRWTDVHSSGEEPLLAATGEFLRRAAGGGDVPGDVKCFGGAVAAASAVAAVRDRRLPEDFTIFGGRLRPRRLRGHLIVTGVLTALLLFIGCAALFKALQKNVDRYNELDGIVTGRTQEISQTRRKIKSSEKMDKEYARILETVHGEDRLTEKLAMIARALPGDVLLNDLRISEESWELTCMTENENTELSGIFRKLPGFKLINLEQRRMGDTLTVIQVRLEKTGGAGRSGK